jgi:hypothetical protein
MTIHTRIEAADRMFCMHAKIESLWYREIVFVNLYTKSTKEKAKTLKHACLRSKDPFRP